MDSDWQNGAEVDSREVEQEGHPNNNIVQR